MLGFRWPRAVLGPYSSLNATLTPDVLLALFSPTGCVEILAAAFVAFGCSGELLLLFRKRPKKNSEEFKKDEHKKHLREVVFVLMVALGVTVELIMLPRNLRETALLNNKTANLESTNLVLRARVLELESEIRDLQPSNQPLFTVSAFVAIKVKGTNLDRAIPGQTVGELFICQTPEVAAEPSKRLPPLSSFACQTLPVSPEDFPDTSAAHKDERWYHLWFHWEGGAQKYYMQEIESRLEEMHAARLDLDFVPPDTKTVEGFVVVVANFARRREFTFAPGQAPPGKFMAIADDGQTVSSAQR